MSAAMGFFSGTQERVQDQLTRGNLIPVSEFLND